MKGEGTFDALVAHDQALVRCPNMTDKGTVLGYGRTSVEAAKRMGLWTGGICLRRSLG
jgi:hypothetical protein